MSNCNMLSGSGLKVSVTQAVTISCFPVLQVILVLLGAYLLISHARHASHRSTLNHKSQRSKKIARLRLAAIAIGIFNALYSVYHILCIVFYE